LKDEVQTGDASCKLLDIMNPPGMFEDGKRLRNNTAKDLPALSGKLLPEFDKRRSIKDMFTKKPDPSPTVLPALDSQASTITDGDMEEEPGASFVFASPKKDGQRLGSQSRDSLPTGPSNAALKRRATGASASTTVKRSKSSIAGASTLSAEKGQKSLKGFFMPKTPELGQEGENAGFDHGASTEQLGQSRKLSLPFEKQESHPGEPKTPLSRTSSVTAEASPSKSVDEEIVIDQVASKETWDKLFTKRSAPKCESHGEPCTSYTTKKNGMNRGRAFWLCSR
jgi:AP endonuclease 2